MRRRGGVVGDSRRPTTWAVGRHEVHPVVRDLPGSVKSPPGETGPAAQAGRTGRAIPGAFLGLCMFLKQYGITTKCLPNRFFGNKPPAHFVSQLKATHSFFERFPRSWLEGDR